MNKFHRFSAYQKEPDTMENILYDSIHMIFEKRQN